GRHFYDRLSLKDKQRLVSTGLWLTALFGFVVILSSLVLRDRIYHLFFDSTGYQLAFYLSLLWAPISALYTYLIVMMRYEKKPRLYFTLVNVQLVIRILASVICVAVLRMGVTGVIVGHLIGESSSIIMFAIVLRKYFGFYFYIPDMKSIIQFSLPLVPAVLIISFQKPLIRYLVANLLSIKDMGYYTVALQMASILGFVQYGLRMSWGPHLYEIIEKPGYGNEVKKIYNFFLGIVALVALLIMFNGRLLLQVLTTAAYYPAASIIGFVVLNDMLEIIRQISGCGPVIAKKTIYNTYYEFAASLAAVLGFLLLHKYIGIIGLAIAFLAGTMVKFTWSWHLTKRFTEISFSMLPTYSIVLGLALVATVYASITVPHLISIVMSLVALSLYLYINRTKFAKAYIVAINKVSALKRS
ncbi:MAG: oligosaccharide flippase family protein, partial [Candidatus Cloacimonetes bacterium]|nr:oligosaccharide flippase family protein [Candidatus Cloacimonadota bacterium]